MSLIGVDQRAADFSETLKAAAVGEYWALESLAADCLPKLTSFAKARGANDPEGLAGTVMMEFFGRLDQLKFDAAPQMWAYLYRMLRSRLIDERRAHKPIELHENQSIEILLPETSGFDEEVVDRHLVDDLLDRLTTEQREILEMRFLHDLSIEETASRTGRTQTAVKGLQRRAIRSLSTAAVVLAVVAFGAAMWAIVTSDSPDNTTISRPAASSSNGGSEEPLEIQPDETGTDDVSAVTELSSDSVKITEAPAAAAEPGSSEFRFVAVDEDSATFECRVDINDFAPCVSPKVYSDLDAGNHVFMVRVADDSERQSPALHVWTIKSPPGADEDVVFGDDSANGNPPGPSTTVSTEANPATSVTAPVKSRQEQLRESTTVYKCGGVSGTYAELETKGYNVTIGGTSHNKIDVRRGTKPDFVVTFGGPSTTPTRAPPSQRGKRSATASTSARARPRTSPPRTPSTPPPVL